MIELAIRNREDFLFGRCLIVTNEHALLTMLRIEELIMRKLMKVLITESRLKEHKSDCEFSEQIRK